MDDLFPPLTCEDILQFQFSSWYPNFKHISMKSVVIRPLGDDFRRFMLADGVHIPKGADDTEDQDGEDEHNSNERDGEQVEEFTFPELDKQIRATIEEFGAVFPKMNFSSPRDASWILPPSSPLKCTSPADVYMLLKASDFIVHDISPDLVFEYCKGYPNIAPTPYDIELVLRKWYHVDPGREFRCFVRGRCLIGISQRDDNYYDYMQDPGTRSKITNAVLDLWSREIRNKWPTQDYIFDVLLTRNLGGGHVIDFNPYAPKTDSLFFTFKELTELSRDTNAQNLPLLRTAEYTTSTRTTPAHLHNMVPLDLLQLGAGKTIDELARDLQDEIKKSSD